MVYQLNLAHFPTIEGGLATELLDLVQLGADKTAKVLAEALSERQVPVFARDRGMTTSHQFAIEAAAYGGGQAAAKKLRAVNILSCGIGLPRPPRRSGRGPGSCATALPRVQARLLRLKVPTGLAPICRHAQSNPERRRPRRPTRQSSGSSWWA